LFRLFCLLRNYFFVKIPNPSWQAGTKILCRSQLQLPFSDNKSWLVFMEPRNRFQGMNSASLCSLAGRYDNPFPTRLLVPLDCLKIPALVTGYLNIVADVVGIHHGRMAHHQCLKAFFFLLSLDRQ
jgi:hypothetical protein